MTSIVFTQLWYMKLYNKQTKHVSVFLRISLNIYLSIYFKLPVFREVVTYLAPAMRLFIFYLYIDIQLIILFKLTNEVFTKPLLSFLPRVDGRNILVHVYIEARIDERKRERQQVVIPQNVNS